MTLAEIRARHTYVMKGSENDGCLTCGPDAGWPCDTMRVLDLCVPKETFETTCQAMVETQAKLATLEAAVGRLPAWDENDRRYAVMAIADALRGMQGYIELADALADLLKYRQGMK